MTLVASGSIRKEGSSSNANSSASVSADDIAKDNVKGDKKLSWKWAMDHLTKILKETKGIATESAISFVRTHLLGTKLIFVVGKAGTGKTTILSELTGLPSLVPSNTVETGTKHYQVCPAIIDDEQYLFVDTAGFGDPNANDIDTFSNIVSCLVAFGPFVQVVGVLFAIGRPGTRLDQQDAKLLNWIQCFCGPHFLHNVTIVTSFWDSYSKNAFKDTLERMTSLYDSDMIRQVLHPSDPDKTRAHLGASFYHHGVRNGDLTLGAYPGLDPNENREERREELRSMIRRRYAQAHYKPAKLQFQAEVENKIPVLQTEAARVLQDHSPDTKVEIVHGRYVVQNKSGTSSLRFLIGAPPVPESWFAGMVKWFSVIRNVAEYYREAREEQRREDQRCREEGRQLKPWAYAINLWAVWRRVQEAWARSS